MKIEIHVKTMRVTASSKPAIIARIKGNLVQTFGTYGNYLSGIAQTNKTVRVYNIEKRNKKVSRKRIGEKTVSKVLYASHWMGYYYDIPVNLLELANLRVEQHTRHFTISKRTK